MFFALSIPELQVIKKYIRTPVTYSYVLKTYWRYSTILCTGNQYYIFAKMIPTWLDPGETKLPIRILNVTRQGLNAHSFLTLYPA